ncbi:MAG: hypothetical protein WC865_14525 [Bacteroidales bacterium]
MHRIILLLMAFSLFVKPRTEAQSPVEISGIWMMSGQLIRKDGAYSNELAIKRGYISLKKDINKTLSIRYTQDVFFNKESTNAGNPELRLKYLYLKVNMHSINWLKDAYFEIGMVHRPWIDFEEKIKDYRVVGPMYLENNQISTSADLGINFVTLIGGAMDADYQKDISSSYPGKYGSISLGIYHGGGFTAVEKNQNKTFESRVSLRPFPDKLPGLQLNHHFIIGMGNQTYNPKFLLNFVYLSYESKRIIMAAHAHSGLGNAPGTYVNPDFNSFWHRGLSIFGECYLYKRTPICFRRICTIPERPIGLGKLQPDSCRDWLSFPGQTEAGT